METQDDLCSYLSQLYRFDVPEQNVSLILSNFSISQIKDDLFLIIGNEMNFRNGTNMGRLMAGLVRFKKREFEEKTWLERQVVIPFSSRLLFAHLNEDGNITLFYFGDGHRQMKVIKADQYGNVNLNDCEFLLTEENVNRPLLRNSFFIEVPERGLKL